MTCAGSRGWQTMAKPLFRDAIGCCICRTKSSSSRFTSSAPYESTFLACFEALRSGVMCNPCVLVVKRFRDSKEQLKGARNWACVSLIISFSMQLREISFLWISLILKIEGQKKMIAWYMIMLAYKPKSFGNFLSFGTTSLAYAPGPSFTKQLMKFLSKNCS